MTSVADPTRPPEVSSTRRFLVPVVLLVVVVVVGVALLLGRSSDQGPARLSIAAAAASPAAIGDMSSVYLVVDNGGGADTVVAATSEAAPVVTLHDTEEADGGAYMVDVEGLDVPSGGALVLSPGGRHLMLHHVFTALSPGDVVRLTVEFELSGAVEVEVPVLSYLDLSGFGTDR